MSSASRLVRARRGEPRHLTVIFKGSDRCNARCRFCAVGDPTGGMVTEQDFDRLIARLDEYIAKRPLSHLELNFHGGEPTLLGAEFLERACQKAQTLPVEVTFSMQSNLLHLDPAVIDVIKRHRIKLGTSIDPIGSGRLDSRGNDAYPTWLANFLKIAKEIPTPGAIFVVTRDALGEARRLFDAALEITAALGEPFGLQINPIYAQGKAAASDQLITPEEYGQFLIEMWRLWESEKRPIKLTPIQQFTDRITRASDREASLSCSFLGRCATTHVGIDYHLNVAGCGRRLDGEGYFGNLRETPLADVLDGSVERQTVRHRSKALREGDGPCRVCRFFDLCHGGCPDDAAVSSDDIANRFEWCDAYHTLFEAIEQAHVGGALLGVRRVHGIVNADDAFDMALPYAEKDIWVLPEADGQNLSFEKTLARLGELKDARVRLWVHNRHVPHLSLWERFLNESQVSVVLFESDGLETAVDHLGALSAHITLEGVSILASDPETNALGALLERFLFENTWRSRIYPFTRILMHTVNNTPVPPTNRFGMAPRPVELLLAPGAENASPAAARILSRLAGETANQQDWESVRKPCLSCEHLDTCGGSFAAGDGTACDHRARALVARIREIGTTIRDQLHDPDFSTSAGRHQI